MPVPMPARSPENTSVVRSRFLGEVAEDPASELFFPMGLPGFESERFLLPVEVPAQRPLVFLQSTRSPDVCFVCLPVSSIAAGFQIDMQPEDRQELGLDIRRDLVMGEDILCLALLLPCAGTVRVNLDAPIVINLRNYRCAQILMETRYGSRRLTAEGTWETLC